jgi:hypothetical protein
MRSSGNLRLGRRSGDNGLLRKRDTSRMNRMQRINVGQDSVASSTTRNVLGLRYDRSTARAVPGDRKRRRDAGPVLALRMCVAIANCFVLLICQPPVLFRAIPYKKCQKRQNQQISCAEQDEGPFPSETDHDTACQNAADSRSKVLARARPCVCGRVLHRSAAQLFTV